jgi:hypothetical protein
MDSIEERARIAEELWSSALQAESTGDYKEAYRLCTEAHDLIMDVPDYISLPMYTFAG